MIVNETNIKQFSNILTQALSTLGTLYWYRNTGMLYQESAPSMEVAILAKLSLYWYSETRPYEQNKFYW